MGATFGDVLEAITIGKKDVKLRWSHILETDTKRKRSTSMDDDIFELEELNLFDNVSADYFCHLKRTAVNRT
jgi:hypothetical protein